MLRTWRVIIRGLHARSIWSALVLIASAASHASGVPLPMYFDRFDRDAGLSQLAVNALTEDASGFLWIGTEDGFDRFDGYTFQHARRDAAETGRLTNGYIADIALESSGALWLATDGGGVIRRDPSTGTYEPLAERLASAGWAAGLERTRAVL